MYINIKETQRREIDIDRKIETYTYRERHNWTDSKKQIIQTLQTEERRKKTETDINSNTDREADKKQRQVKRIREEEEQELRRRRRRR